MTTTRPLLPMAPTGCACCTPTADAPVPDAPGPEGATAAPATRGTDEPGAPAPAQAAYRVEGMTCGHCAGAVTAALEAVDGIRAVNIELVPGGASAVTITGDRPLPADTIRTAVEDAGYTLAPS